MFGPRARRHQAVPCEALTMVLSTCTAAVMTARVVTATSDKHPALGD